MVKDQPQSTGSWPAWKTDAMIAAGLLLLCLATRAMALPASLWEWDDIDFARAIHKFDLASHSPHPPGFPVFVMLARLAYFFLREDHAALLAVNYAFASLLGVVFYFLYREILPDRPMALAAAALGCFAPTLWVHSGIARTDNPSLVIGLATLWLLLRGRRSSRAFLLGCALLGLGMGVRVTIVPLTGLALAIVFFSWVRKKEWKVVLGSIAVTVIGFLSWYIPLILHTGWEEYRRLTRVQSAYIMAHDPIWSPDWTLLERFTGYFVTIWGDGWIMWTIYGLGAFGILALSWRRHWRSVGWMFAAFIPFLVFTVILNTPMGIVVYSMPYIPFFTGLAACGMVLLFRLLLGWTGRPVLANLGVGLTFALAAGLAHWSYPMVKLLHREASPPIQAARYLQKRIDQQRDKLYFDGLMTPHITYFFGNAQTEEWLKEEVTALNLIDPANRDYRKFYLLSTEPMLGLSQRHFHWTPGRGLRRLKPLSVGRYFDVYLSELDAVRDLAFTDGWYPPEASGSQSWRWMGKTGSVALFNDAEEMTLRIEGQLVAGQSPDRPPTLVVKLDGREIARHSGQQVDLTLPVKTDPSRLWSRLNLEAGVSFIPKLTGLNADERELGFQCFGLQWLKPEGASAQKFTVDQFLGEGWYPLQIGKPRSWRWASPRATMKLPALGGAAQLQLIMMAPALPAGERATITVSVAGRRLDSFSPPTEEIITKTYRIPSSAHLSRDCELLIEANRSATFPGDTKKYAFKATSLTWVPAD